MMLPVESRMGALLHSQRMMRPSRVTFSFMLAGLGGSP